MGSLCLDLKLSTHKIFSLKMNWGLLTSLLWLYNLQGAESHLLIDIKSWFSAEENNLVAKNTPPEPTNIISDGKLCDPNVQQHSGYIQFSGFHGDKSYFFWLLESRSNPTTDPLIVWLTGGPGCSSQMALLKENGPCNINKYGNGTDLNKFSWTNKANVIWVDQPAGAGFSCFLDRILQTIASIQEELIVCHR